MVNSRVLFIEFFYVGYKRLKRLQGGNDMVALKGIQAELEASNHPWFKAQYKVPPSSLLLRKSVSNLPQSLQCQIRWSNVPGFFLFLPAWSYIPIFSSYDQPSGDIIPRIRYLFWASTHHLHYAAECVEVRIVPERLSSVRNRSSYAPNRNWPFWFRNWPFWFMPIAESLYNRPRWLRPLALRSA